MIFFRLWLGRAGRPENNGSGRFFYVVSKLNQILPPLITIERFDYIYYGKIPKLDNT